MLILSGWSFWSGQHETLKACIPVFIVSPLPGHGASESQSRGQVLNEYFLNKWINAELSGLGRRSVWVWKAWVVLEFAVDAQPRVGAVAGRSCQELVTRTPGLERSWGPQVTESFVNHGQG